MHCPPWATGQPLCLCSLSYGQDSVDPGPHLRRNAWQPPQSINGLLIPASNHERPHIDPLFSCEVPLNFCSTPIIYQEVSFTA